MSCQAVCQATNYASVRESAIGTAPGVSPLVGACFISARRTAGALVRIVRAPLSGYDSNQTRQSALEGIRTPNLLIRSQMLYPLSYERMIQ